MHGLRNRHAGLDVAILVQRLNQASKVGDQRIVQLVDPAGDAVDQLRQVHPRRALDRTEHKPAEEEGDRFARPIAECATGIGEAGERRRLVFHATDRTRHDAGRNPARLIRSVAVADHDVTKGAGVGLSPTAGHVHGRRRTPFPRIPDCLGSPFAACLLPCSPSLSNPRLWSDGLSQEWASVNP